MNVPPSNPSSPETQRPRRVAPSVRLVPETSEATTSDFATRLVQLVGEMTCQGTWQKEGLTHVARELAAELRATRVLLCGGSNGSLVLAHSGPGQIAANGGEGLADVLRTVQAAPKVAGLLTVVTSADASSPIQIALQNLAQQHQAPLAIAVVLPHENVRNMLLAWGEFSATDVSTRLQTCADPLANVIASWQANNRTWQSLCRNALAWCRTQRGKITLAAALSLAIVLAIPMPYHVPCSATIEPPVRSFLEAPFDATLDKSLVNPGDQVEAGQILARLDNRQMQLDLAAAAAAVEEAQQKRQAARASHDGTAALLAQLDLKQATVKLQTLRDRERRLLITSPIDGIVVRGDLRRVEGSPVKQGQTLFEVAAVGEMLAELAIPESEIAYVRTDMPVTIRLEAFGGRSLQGSIRRIHPRAQLQNNASIFLAEVELTDAAERIEQFRPGMQGRASITSDWHALGWNLLHRPWQAIRRAWEG